MGGKSWCAGDGEGKPGMETKENYFDLQVNGYAGVDFNHDDLNAEELHRACRQIRADGVGGILATIVTETADRMAGRLARLVELRQHDPLVAQTIAGFHIEGPFISDKPIFRGAYPLEAIGPANRDVMMQLLDAADGLTRVVTLAPEQDRNFAIIRGLADRGITVAAGHTDASLDELRGAIDAGLTMFTHLGNGTPPQLSRHNNIIQRALSCADHLWCCFIGDGVHIPFFALRNYLQVAGNRAVMVTDAIAPAGLGAGRFTIGRTVVKVGADLVAWAPGRAHLLGAVVTMRKIAENLQEHLALSTEAIHRLTVLNPRCAIGEEVDAANQRRLQ